MVRKIVSGGHCSTLCRLPTTRQQRRQLRLLHGWQAGEHIAHIFPGLNSPAPAAHDDTVNDRAAPPRFGVANEQPVLLADRTGPNRVLSQIVVYLQTSVLEIATYGFPFGQSILDRFAQWT